MRKYLSFPYINTIYLFNLFNTMNVAINCRRAELPPFKFCYTETSAIVASFVQ